MCAHPFESFLSGADLEIASAVQAEKVSGQCAALLEESLPLMRWQSVRTRKRLHCTLISVRGRGMLYLSFLGDYLGDYSGDYSP